MLQANKKRPKNYSPSCYQWSHACRRRVTAWWTKYTRSSQSWGYPLHGKAWAADVTHNHRLRSLCVQLDGVSVVMHFFKKFKIYPTMKSGKCIDLPTFVKICQNRHLYEFNKNYTLYSKLSADFDISQPSRFWNKQSKSTVSATTLFFEALIVFLFVYLQGGPANEITKNVITISVQFWVDLHCAIFVDQFPIKKKRVLWIIWNV